MRRWIAFVTGASLLIIASCGGSSDPAGPDPESDLVNPVLDPIREVLAGPGGGEIRTAMEFPLHRVERAWPEQVDAAGASPYSDHSLTARIAHLIINASCVIELTFTRVEGESLRLVFPVSSAGLVAPFRLIIENDRSVATPCRSSSLFPDAVTPKPSNSPDRRRISRFFSPPDPTTRGTSLAI